MYIYPDDSCTHTNGSPCDYVTVNGFGYDAASCH